jgi:hypothetical protein
MAHTLSTLCYLVASVLFILALRGLSHPETSQKGNQYGMIGMGIAIGATMLQPGMSFSGIGIIIAGLAVGGSIGAVLAQRIAMTSLPQLVAAFHSLVGMAAVAVAAAAFYAPDSFGIAKAGGGIKTASLLEMSLGLAIGAITFSGSVIAFLKLAGRMSGAPLVFKGQHMLNAALSVLLQEGIGDTIRISLTPEPGGDRTREVIVAQEILQTMGLRAFTPMVIACPGCGRTSSTVFQDLADRIQTYLREQMPLWKTKYPGVESMNVAVMGCVVNGPGESRHADLGISLPGTGEVPAAPVFVDGQRTVTLKGDHIAEEFQTIVQEYVSRRYGSRAIQS